MPQAKPRARAARTGTQVVEHLVESHRRFLGFLEARLGSRTEAEEVLQGAFVRALEKGDTIRDDESVVAWFYRLLRNALVDRHRKAGAEARMRQLQAVPVDPEPEVQRAICGCIEGLLPTIKPEYAEIVRRVDLEETKLGRVAPELGISVNNATVRLHRARQALRRQLEKSCGTCTEHGCLDCHCKETEGQSSRRGHARP